MFLLVIKLNWRKHQNQNNVSIFDNVIIEKNVFCGPSMVFTNVTILDQKLVEKMNTNQH